MDQNFSRKGIADLFQDNPSQDTLSGCFNDFSTFHEGRDVNAVDGPAILFA